MKDSRVQGFYPLKKYMAKHDLIVDELCKLTGLSYSVINRMRLQKFASNKSTVLKVVEALSAYEPNEDLIKDFIERKRIIN